MDTPPTRWGKLIDAMLALAQGRETERLPEDEGDDEAAHAVRAFNQMLLRQQDDAAVSNIAISELAGANVRLLMWNEALRKIGSADSKLRRGELQAFYRQIVADAMEMTCARYGALGIFDAQGRLAGFITEGIDEETAARIGAPPSGKGLLAALFHEHKPVRVSDIRSDPRSCGFPPGHPPMKTLLGAPIRTEGQVKGVIYLADKENGILFNEEEERLPAEFSEDDVTMLDFFAEFLSHALERIELTNALYVSNRQLQKEKAEQQELIQKLNEAQNQLLQSEKMASIGQLAAGVAHEINNPIGYVNSNLGTLEKYHRELFTMLDACEQVEPLLAAEAAARIQALREKLDINFLKEDLTALMRESGEGILRVKKIVQDLKDFSHVDEAEWQWVDLHMGLESTLNVVWNEIKYKAEVVKEYGDLPQVECLPSQLNQVFMNLLVNAAHAIEERGTITIRTGTRGSEVWVEIADTGKGIPPENLNRIFEPFFTTKPVGKGTGLGLSLSYSIMQKHHGRIEVESEVGTGATFRVCLPVKQPEGGIATAQANGKNST